MPLWSFRGGFRGNRGGFRDVRGLARRAVALPKRGRAERRVEGGVPVGERDVRRDAVRRAVVVALAVDEQRVGVPRPPAGTDDNEMVASSETKEMGRICIRTGASRACSSKGRRWEQRVRWEFVLFYRSRPCAHNESTGAQIHRTPHMTDREGESNTKVERSHPCGHNEST
eukprot:1896044-Pyramimonas_sp.AAC.1